jgi:hypothetical protein
VGFCIVEGRADQVNAQQLAVAVAKSESRASRKGRCAAWRHYELKFVYTTSQLSPFLHASTM